VLHLVESPHGQELSPVNTLARVIALAGGVELRVKTAALGREEPDLCQRDSNHRRHVSMGGVFLLLSRFISLAKICR